MPYLPTAQEWLKQSTLLLQARPTTTRITTKYTIKRPSTKPRASKAAEAERVGATADSNTKPTTQTEPSTSVAPTQPPPTTRATLTLKTYDPVSGVTLKYQTDKAAEVGRLISSLSRLGRGMAGLPEVKDDVIMLDPAASVVEGAGGEVASGMATPVGDGTGLGKVVGAAVSGGQQGGAGGKKSKKKGKK